MRTPRHFPLITCRTFGASLLIAALGVCACAASQVTNGSTSNAISAYRSRYAAACERLRAPPRNDLERLVKEPDQRSYESTWSAHHPEAPHGSLTKASIREGIGARIQEVRQCYEAAIQGWPSAAGRVTVRFGIDPRGTVGSAVVVSNDTKIEELGCCIAERMHDWKFPAPEGGGCVIVTYPFVLSQH